MEKIKESKLWVNWGFCIVCALAVVALCLGGCAVKESTQESNEGSTEQAASVEKTQSNTNSNSISDDKVAVDANWSYEQKDGKTEFIRDDGYKFSVKGEFLPTYRPTPDKEQAKTTFSDGEIMSFDIVNESYEPSVTNKQNSDNGKFNYGKAEVFWSEKYTQSNSVHFWVESEKLWIDATCGTSLLTSKDDVMKYVELFEF